MLILPGPQNNNVTNAARYKNASSDSIIALPALAPKIATSIVITNGKAANLVNKPSTIKSEQSTSAKIASTKLNLLPNPKKL